MKYLTNNQKDKYKFEYDLRRPGFVTKLIYNITVGTNLNI